MKTGRDWSDAATKEIRRGDQVRREQRERAGATSAGLPTATGGWRSRRWPFFQGESNPADSFPLSFTYPKLPGSTFPLF